MNIELELDYTPSSSSLLVYISCADILEIVDLNKKVKTLKFNFDLPICNQVVILKLYCKNLDIVKHPITVSNIILDDFYQGPKILYRGCPNYDQQFFLHAEQNHMYLDPTVTDASRLDFTGTLCYKFDWPFYKNIFL